MLEKLTKYFDKKSVKEYVAALFTYLLSIGIFLSPIIVDYKNLPKGYELPKVHFIQILSGILIILGIIYVSIILADSFLKRKIKIKKSFIILTAVTILLLLSALSSSYKDIAIFGNVFREQGVITYLLMIFAAYFTFKIV